MDVLSYGGGELESEYQDGQSSLFCFLAGNNEEGSVTITE
jgi:hypothetical protein